MHKIFVIRLYFALDALHVSDYISPSSVANFISCTSYLVNSDTCGSCVTIATKGAGVSGHTGICDVQLIKVATDNGLIKSETCRASNAK
jgi:hypothetical protein